MSFQGFTIKSPEDTFSVYLMIKPLLYLVFVELALKYRLISSPKFAFPFFNAKHKLPLIYFSSRPLFLSKTVLQVVLPTSLIEGPIIVDELSYPMNFISIPISCVVISILLDQSAFTTSLIIQPITFVEISFWPNLDAKSFPFVLLNNLPQVLF